MVEKDSRKSCKASQSEIMILESSVIMRNMLQMIHERSVSMPPETRDDEITVYMLICLGNPI